MFFIPYEKVEITLRIFQKEVHTECTSAVCATPKVHNAFSIPVLFYEVMMIVPNMFVKLQKCISKSKPLLG